MKTSTKYVFEVGSAEDSHLAAVTTAGTAARKIGAAQNFSMLHLKLDEVEVKEEGTFEIMGFAESE